MMYRKKVILNIAGSITTQLISILIAFITPKLMISYYGSELNGLVSSASQVVQYFTLFEGSVAAAAGFPLFKALKDKDTDRINGIFLP